MPSTLTDLPDELLTQIISCINPIFAVRPKRYDSYYRRTICALALTNRRISFLAQQQLYRHLAFAIGVEDVTPWQCEPIPYLSHFLRTCQEQPDLLNSIQIFELTRGMQVCDTDDDDDDDATILEALLLQLGLSRSLIHLRLALAEIDIELAVSPLHTTTSDPA